jgi:ribosomal protein S12 methylthiotransferase
MPKKHKKELQIPTVSMVSLGCAKNLVDTENLMGELYNSAFRLSSEPELSDVVIINTCGFLQSSIDEARDEISDLLALKKQGGVQTVMAMGCYVSRGKDDVAKKYPKLDGVYALDEVDNIVSDLQDMYAYKTNVESTQLAGIRPISATLPHYSYLKISEGCDRTCTYCTIPDIRGPNVDKTIEALVEETKGLVARGTKEINIIAQDTTAYGIHAYGKPKLLDLLKSLEEVSGVEWIRLLYAYPDYIDEALSDFLLSSPKMVKYLELPIQHVAESLLKRMNRGGSFKIYDTLFDKLRKKNPDYALRTTVIVGFPGETEEEFETMLEYCKYRKFDRLGAFKFLRESGTPADKMKDQIPQELIDERYDRLMQLQSELHFEKNKQLIGSDIEFIVDEVDETGFKGVGRTWRDIVDIDSMIILESSIPLSPGMIATARVKGTEDYDLVGVL